MGPPHGGACSHSLRVDLTSARAYATLDELHLDHEQDLVVTCDKWDDGVDGAFLGGQRRCCAIPTTAVHDLPHTLQHVA